MENRKDRGMTNDELCDRITKLMNYVTQGGVGVNLKKIYEGLDEIRLMIEPPLPAPPVVPKVIQIVSGGKEELYALTEAGEIWMCYQGRWIIHSAIYDCRTKPEPTVNHE